MASSIRSATQSWTSCLYPTLTGLAEWSHLASPEIDLNTHITNVVNTILWEDLHDITLVGPSYGGSVVTGVADRTADRINRLVYLDAFILEDGQSVMSLQPPHRVEYYDELVKHKGEGWKLPPNPAEFYGVDEPQDQKWLDDLSVP